MDFSNDQHSLEWELIEMLKSIITKLIVSIIVISILFSCSIGAFIWYLNQYDFVSEETQVTATTDDNGTAIAVLGNEKGQVNVNGESDSK